MSDNGVPALGNDARALHGARVLLTGASGFVGTHVARALHASGARVTGVSRTARDGSDGLDWIALRDWSEVGLREALSGGDWTAVVNAAAYGVAPSDRDPGEASRVNAHGVGLLARLAAERGAKAFVQIGSSSEYNATLESGPLHPERSPLETRRLYGATKAAGMVLARATCAAGGVGFRGLRLFNAYGPGEAPHRLLPSLVRGLQTGRVALSSGEQERDFVYVEDAAAAIAAALADALADGGDWIANIATGRATSVRAFAETIADAVGAPRERLGFGDIAQRPDDLPRVVGSPNALHRYLPRLHLRPPEDGIPHAVAGMTGT